MFQVSYELVKNILGLEILFLLVLDRNYFVIDDPWFIKLYQIMYYHIYISIQTAWNLIVHIFGVKVFWNPKLDFVSKISKIVTLVVKIETWLLVSVINEKSVWYLHEIWWIKNFVLGGSEFLQSFQKTNSEEGGILTFLATFLTFPT